jgi:SAM-dependent methyltransferase
MDEQTLSIMTARLEDRGRHPLFARVIDEYLTKLALVGSEAILDLGCGTGMAARAIARYPKVSGPITAIDISSHLVEAGKRLAHDEGLDGRIDFRVGDAHLLGLPEDSFDIVVMHTLISHVADPMTVLIEARRLLKPGTGRLVVFDGDYASWTFATEAADGGESTDRAIQQGLVAQPRVMRAMPRLLATAGFALLSSRAHIVADIGRSDFFAGSLPTFRVLLPRAGQLSEQEANLFIDELERASAENRFFGASNFYTYIARHDAIAHSG